jgi:hypothetical protein
VNLVQRGLAAVAAAGLWLLLAACGPGVGGTGTGPDPGALGLQQFGATPQAVCSEPFAGLLGCEAVPGSAEPVLQTEVLFVGPCGVAAFEGDGIELDVLCDGLYFAGRWGVDRGGRSRYFGLVGVDPMLADAAPATLEVLPSGTLLVLTLRDAAGAILAGPFVLQPSVP